RDASFGYLVTNRHVAECWDEGNKNTPMPVKAIAVQLNLLTGSAETVVVNPAGNAAWIYPDDPSVDLAILPFSPNQKLFDFKTVPISVLSTDDDGESGAIVEGER